MHKTLCTAVVLALCAERAAHAQMTITAPLDYSTSAITLYGNADVGPTWVNNVGGASKVFLDSSTAHADRVGILGRENLGAGLSAVFRFETEFFMNGNFQLNGSKSDGFTGQDFVGISDQRRGTLTLGRQFGVINDAAASSSIIFGGIYASHIASADLTGKDADNSIKYQSPLIHGFRFTGMYAFSDPVNGRGHSIQAGLTWHHGPFSGALAYERVASVSESPYTDWGLTRFLGMPVTAASPAVVLDRLSAYAIGGGYELGPVRFIGEAIYLQMDKGNSRGIMPTYDGGLIWSITPFTSVGASVERSTLADAAWTQYTLGGSYSLSKTTRLTAFVVFQRAAGSAAFADQETIGYSSNQNQLSVHVGIMKYF